MLFFVGYLGHEITHDGHFCGCYPDKSPDSIGRNPVHAGGIEGHVGEVLVIVMLGVAVGPLVVVLGGYLLRVFESGLLCCGVRNVPPILLF